MKKKFIEKISNGFESFENVISVVLSILIGAVIVISTIRIGEKFFSLFLIDFFKPDKITYDDYKELFARILSLLISLEFLSSILKVLKSHEIRVLVLDVLLITMMAIGRKLIIFDYDEHEPILVFALAALILSIGISYFFIKKDWSNSTKLNS